MKSDDYGYFGSGSSGYAHYMQTFNSIYGKSKPTAQSAIGTGKKLASKPTATSSKPNSTGQAFEQLILVVGILGLVVLLMALFSAAGSAEIAFEAIGYLALGIVFLWWVFK